MEIRTQGTHSISFSSQVPLRVKNCRSRSWCLMGEMQPVVTEKYGFGYRGRSKFGIFRYLGFRRRGRNEYFSVKQIHGSEIFH